MAVNGSAAYAVYPQNVALNQVVRTLQRGGFDKENICMMLSPTHPIASIVRDTNCGAFNADANVVSAGLLGWLTEFGAVVIPTFGLFIRSSQFFRALVSDQDSFCGRSSTLGSLGFAPPDRHSSLRIMPRSRPCPLGSGIAPSGWTYGSRFDRRRAFSERDSGSSNPGRRSRRRCNRLTRSTGEPSIHFQIGRVREP